MMIKSSRNITKYYDIVNSKHKGRQKKKHDKLGFSAEPRLTSDPSPPLLTLGQLSGYFMFCKQFPGTLGHI